MSQWVSEQPACPAEFALLRLCRQALAVEAAEYGGMNTPEVEPCPAFEAARRFFAQLWEAIEDCGSTQAKTAADVPAVALLSLCVTTQGGVAVLTASWRESPVHTWHTYPCRHSLGCANSRWFRPVARHPLDWVAGAKCVPLKSPPGSHPVGKGPVVLGVFLAATWWRYVPERGAEKTKGLASENLLTLMDPGAGERSRTLDLLITNELLYQLSYTGVSATSHRWDTAKPAILAQLFGDWQRA